MSTPLCSTGGLVLAAGDCLRMFAERRWTYMDVGNPETMRWFCSTCADEVREGAGSGDRQNAGRILNAPPAASAQSDSKKASKVSFAWKRRNGVPTGKTFANAFSFM